jgi:hypothetical protein
MKKLLASILCLTMVMSLAACNGKQPEQSGQGQESETTVPDIVETEVPLTETTKAPDPVNLATDFVKCKSEKFAYGEEDDYGFRSEISLYIPELLIKSSYADSVNKEISDTYEKIKKAMNKEETAIYDDTSYIAYLTKEGVLSLVFIANAESANAVGHADRDVFKVYNIDTKTGEKVENARLAQIAGVSDITKAAKDALQNYFNKSGEFEVKDYKVVSEKDEENGSGKTDVEYSFRDEYINDKMQIGLTNEGKMFFVTKLSQASGTDFSYELYGSDGTNLDDMDNPFWIGDKDRDEEDDNGKETAAATALNKKDYLNDKVLKVKIKDEYNKKKKKWTYVTAESHFPVLLIKSSYADSINKAVDKKYKEYNKIYKKDGIYSWSIEYIAYLSNEGVLSLVLIEATENDQIECRVYNIDVKTGEKVDNARIAQIAGVSNIRKAAMDALQAKYNKEKHYKVKNYKVSKKKGVKKNAEDKEVEKSFNEKHLNAKMKIGLTDKGKIFFISEYETGAGENEGIYDANGKDLYNDSNPNLVWSRDD